MTVPMGRRFATARAGQAKVTREQAEWEAQRVAAELERLAAIKADARERETTRHRYTRDELVGADLIHDGSRWRVVVTVNKATVTVRTAYSWNDRIPFDKVHDVRIPT